MCYVLVIDGGIDGLESGRSQSFAFTKYSLWLKSSSNSQRRRPKQICLMHNYADTPNQTLSSEDHNIQSDYQQDVGGNIWRAKLITDVLRIIKDESISGTNIFLRYHRLSSVNM